MHGGKGDADGYKSGMAGRWGEDNDVRGKEMERCKRRVEKWKEVTEEGLDVWVVG